MTTPSPTRQVAATRQQTIRELLGKQHDQFAKVLPQFLTPERFIRVALTTINKNHDLLNCTDTSLMACLMDAAQLGLETDSAMGRCYLIPFKDKCTLIIGYRGFIELAYRSGQVQSIMSQVVHENDRFSFHYGIPDVLLHEPKFSNRGKPIGAWAKVMLKDGAYAFDFMAADDIAAIRKRSKAANNGPWVTDEMEMWRKTVVRRLSKYIPLSVEFRDAVAMEDTQEAEEETRLRAAKIVIPTGETTVKPSTPALEEGTPPIPFPQMPTRQRETVPAANQAEDESQESLSHQEPPSGPPTPEEQEEIRMHEQAEAAREQVSSDPLGALRQIMAIDNITDDELMNALRELLKIPHRMKVPDNLTKELVVKAMERNAWTSIRTFILGQRQQLAP